MIRLSVLRNCPVICREQRIGLLQSAALDDERKRVRALIISCGLRGKRMIPMRAVSAFADGFILVTDVCKCSRLAEEHGACFVRDTDGLLSGCVTDYAFDEEKNSILAIEVMTGYSLNEFRRRIWVYEYHLKAGSKNELIIPASLGSGLIYSKEGNE